MCVSCACLYGYIRDYDTRGALLSKLWLEESETFNLSCVLVLPEILRM